MPQDDCDILPYQSQTCSNSSTPGAGHTPRLSCASGDAARSVLDYRPVTHDRPDQRRRTTRMEPASYAFQIGDIACHALLDGGDTLDLERFMRRFPQGTEAAYREVYASLSLSLEDAASSLNILLAQVAGRRCWSIPAWGARRVVCWRTACA
ncbi:hypothetical protein HC928_20925 [bacterium]|nr:hypothetical protein [bacterium]